MIAEDKLLSIVLCTVGRLREVMEFLLSILPQNLKKIELVIVDQNEDRRIEDLCREIESIVDYKIIKMEVPCLSKARNLGFTETRAKYILFADDDSLLPNAFIPNLEAVIARHPQAEVITGITRDITDNSVSVCKFREGTGYWVDFRNIFHSMTAGATIFRRAIIESNLFDERFGFNSEYKSGEDIELGLRLLNRGVSIYFDSTLCLYHPKTVTNWGKAERRKMRWHGIGAGAAIRKNLTRKNAAPILCFLLGRMIRPLIGAAIYLISDTKKSRGYLSALYGRLYGFLSYRGRHDLPNEK